MTIIKLLKQRLEISASACARSVSLRSVGDCSAVDRSNVVVVVVGAGGKLVDN